MEGELVFYVKDGVMHSGRVLFKINIDIESSGSRFGDIEYIRHIFSLGMGSSDTNTSRLILETSEKGELCLISGMDVVPVNEIFSTKEEAANYHYNKLLEE